MSKIHHTPATAGREQKLSQFAGIEKRNKSRNWLYLIAAMAVLGGAGYLATAGLKGGEPVAKQIAATPGPAAVKIPTGELADGKARFFTYKTSDSRTVRFFVMRSSDGVFRAAFDACDVCFHAKQGYVQDGDDMVCRKCGRHFHSAKINEVSGGCNPIGITRTVSDGQLLIAAKDLEMGSSYF